MSFRSIYSDSLSSTHSGRNVRRESGFSLPELLVAMSIMIILTTVILTSNNTFSNRLVVDNLAHAIGLAVREAQTYALSVRETPSGANTFLGYGTYFSTAAPTEFVLYVDANANKRYDVGSGCGSGLTECVDRRLLKSGMSIASLCVTGGCTAATDLDIVFTRPNPDATISSGGSVYAQGTITVRSAKGATRKVVVSTTGQVSVQ